MMKECLFSQCPEVAVRRRHRAAGFTIFEVMAAAIVMAFAIATSITTLQRGYRTIDLARSTTIAGQILQSVMEDIRLQTWAQLGAAETAAGTGVAATVTIGSSFHGNDAIAMRIVSNYVITR